MPPPRLRPQNRGVSLLFALKFRFASSRVRAVEEPAVEIFFFFNFKESTQNPLPGSLDHSISPLGSASFEPTSSPSVPLDLGSASFTKQPRLGRG